MARAIQSSSNAELAAVVSRSRHRSGEFGDEHGSPPVFGTVDALLEQADVDIVYVASPNTLHACQVVTAARARKHVLCEKPMAADAASCVDMIEACAANGVVLGIGFQYRQHPAHRLMRDTVCSGQLGAGVFADAAVHLAGLATPAWYNDPKLSAGSGVLSMTGVHRIDLLRFVMAAEVDEVSAFVDTRARGRQFDDAVTAMLRFDNGVVATVRFSIDAARAGDPVAIYGSGGNIAGIGTTSQWWSADGGKVVVRVGTDEVVHEFPRADLYLDQVESFTRAIQGDVGCIATGVDGLRAVEISAAIYESAASGHVVRLDRGRG
jgi:predicted dehydrogenase